MKIKKDRCLLFPLVLKGKWYDLIASGEKKEEYPDNIGHWKPRIDKFQRRCAAALVDLHGKGLNGRPIAVVAFSRGYRKPAMFFSVRFNLADRDWREVNGADKSEFWAAAAIRGYALHPEWGEPDGDHYVFTLGEKVEFMDNQGGAA